MRKLFDKVMTHHTESMRARQRCHYSEQGRLAGGEPARPARKVVTQKTP
jgi:hypothetical protein